jgi:hypothetical protein
MALCSVYLSWMSMVLQEDIDLKVSFAWFSHRQLVPGSTLYLMFAIRRLKE